MAQQVLPISDLFATTSQIGSLVDSQAKLTAKVIAKVGPGGTFKTFAKDRKNQRHLHQFTGPDFAGNFNLKKLRVDNNTGVDLATGAIKALKATKDPNLKNYKGVLETRLKAHKAFFEAETKLFNGDTSAKVANSLTTSVNELVKLKGKGGISEAETLAETVGCIDGIANVAPEIRAAMGKSAGKLAELKAYAEAFKPGLVEQKSKEVVQAAEEAKKTDQAQEGIAGKIGSPELAGPRRAAA